MKKKWIAIVGSPRRWKNSEKLTDIIIEALKKKDIEVQKYNLNQDRMAVCTNCEYCIKYEKCRIEDDISEILDRFKTCDGLILTAPSYNYNVPAQMKILLDRSFSLNDYSNGIWSSRIPSGKKAIIAGVCKGKTQDSMGFTINAMRICIDELGYEIVDTIEYYNTKEYPVSENQEIQDEIEKRININASI